MEGCLNYVEGHGIVYKTIQNWPLIFLFSNKKLSKKLKLTKIKQIRKLHPLPYRRRDCNHKAQTKQCKRTLPVM